MKVSELEKLLRKQGIIFYSHGTRHDWWINPVNGNRTQIPRHRSKEIPNGTKEKILKDLGLK